MKKYTKLILSPGLFPVKFYFWLGNDDFASLNKWMNRTKAIKGNLDYPSEDCVGYAWPLGAHFLIWTRDLPTFKNPYTLMHECVHAAMHSMHYLGMDDEEYICYTTEYLVKKALDAVNTK